MDPVIARCENCGAALRLDLSVVQVTCDYCHVTIFVRDAPSDAPRVTFAAPPELLDKTKLTLGVAIASGLLALGLMSIVIVSSGDTTVIVSSIVPIAVFGTLAVLSAVGYPREKARSREARVLREQGIPGRAIVRAVGVADDRNAKLQLDVEIGPVKRRVVHQTTIPALAVPQIVAGAALPVLVHPKGPEHIEVQWHLL